MKQQWQRLAVRLSKAEIDMTGNRRQFLRTTVGSTVAAAMSSELLNAQRQVSTRSHIRAVAFDALVIFDMGTVAKRADEEFPGKGLVLTKLWRLRQFEYTWLRTAGERYRDFWHIAEDALKYACAAMKLQLSAAQRDSLMKAYHELRPWPDVLKALTEFKRQKIRMAFLTNFTVDMIIRNLAGTELSGFFEDHLTTDRVGAFKPSPRAYQMALDYFGYQRHEIAFVAFAPWDVAGAKWFGYPTFWINRAGVSPEELDVLPDFMGHSLSGTEMFF